MSKNENKINNLINIDEIMSIHYFELKSDFSFLSEIHDYWELVYINSGSAIITADGTENIHNLGEIIFHKPNAFHAIESDKNDPPNVFIITFECDSSYMKFFNDRRMSVPAASVRWSKNTEENMYNEESFFTAFGSTDARTAVLQL